MAIDRRLLETLRCPVTKRPLRALKSDMLERVNKAIESEALHYADGRLVKKPLSDGLITDNERSIYRVDDGIPVMFEDESIPASQVDGADTADFSGKPPSSSVESLFGPSS